MDNRIYVIALADPEKGRIRVRSLAGLAIQGIKRLEDDKVLQWKAYSDGVEVELPAYNSVLDGYVLEVCT